MHEIYRKYLDQELRRFLIIVFKDEKGYLLKIFLHREAVHQFPFDAPNQDMKRISEMSAGSFEKFVEIAREWILENYQVNP
jgi:hypothetical protein